MSRSWWRGERASSARSMSSSGSPRQTTLERAIATMMRRGWLTEAA